MVLKYATKPSMRPVKPGITLALLLVMMCIDGCADSKSSYSDPIVTSRSFVSKVERQCGVVYTKPKVIGEALGFTCAHTISGGRLGVIYTRILRCSPFAIIVVNVGEDRMQGCISSVPRRLAGTITCESDGTLAVAARTQPQTRSATVQLSSGEEATSSIFSLNAIDRDRWGGVYFNVLSSRTPVKAVLIERDQAGRAFHRLSLTPVGRCLMANGAR